MPAGDSMPDTYIAIMLQSLKKKEQVLDEIIRLDDRQKDTLTDPECPFDVFDETVEAKSACIDQLNQLDSGFEKLYAQVAVHSPGNGQKCQDSGAGSPQQRTDA